MAFLKNNFYIAVCAPSFFLLLASIVLSCRSIPSNPDKPHVTIRTKFGDIEVELYPRQAPKTVGAFLSYVDSGFYKNGSFYRVLNENNQPSGSGSRQADPGWYLADGSEEGRSDTRYPPRDDGQQTHILHTDGTISMARTTPGTAGTEFFICLGDQPGYDYGGADSPDGQGFAAFGKVVKGMEVVKAIYACHTRTRNCLLRLFPSTISRGIKNTTP